MNWLARVRDVMPPPTGDPARHAEILDEMAAHCADRYDELRRLGHADDETVAIVSRELEDAAGRVGPQVVRLGGGHQPASGWHGLVRGWRQDVRFAMRLLSRAPAFTAASVLTLALAIGAVTAIFTVVERVLLRPLPLPDADRLVLVWEVSPQGDDHNVVARANYLDWVDRASAFEHLGAFGRAADVALIGAGEPRRVSVTWYSRNAITALGVKPAAGRLFSEAEGRSGGPAVVLLGYNAWVTGFGAEPGAVGRMVTLDGERYEIVGVLPRAGVRPEPTVDFVLPLRFSEEDRNDRTSHNYMVLGRLKDGVSVEMANASMKALVANLTQAHPKELTGWSASVVPLQGDIVRTVRPLLTLVMSVVVIVLVIACANLANLQLARASTRRAEMAVRSAIGAGRRRLVSQLLVESVVLSTLGGAIGLALAFVLVRVLVGAAPADIPFLESVTIDGRVLPFTALTTMASAAFVGLLPALQISRADLRPLLHGARIPSDAGQARSRLVLVAAQVALALILLVAATLVVRSFWKLNAVEHGFDPENVLTVQLDLPGARYPDAASHLRFYDGLFERMRTVPGVVGVAGSTVTPGHGAGVTFSYAIEGRPSTNPTGREDPLPLQAVTPGFFETLRIPILEGRGLTAEDRQDGRQVVVINAALARKHWPDGGALGHRLSFRPGQTPWLEIVGVVGDTHDEGLDSEAPPTLYVPFTQRAPAWRWMSWQTMLVRAESNPEALVGAVRAIVRDLDPDLPLLQVGTMTERFAENSARRRFAMWLLGGFATLAVLLGAVGIYGVLACGVAERRAEIGVRLALGARTRDIVVSVARPVLVYAGAGLVIGVLVSAAATRFLRALLFQVEPSDPISYLAVVALVGVIGGLAALAPIRRAVDLDPVDALREG